MKIEEQPINSLPPFPNNPDVPLILYKGVFDEKSVRPEDFENLFNQNSWTGSWRNGVYGIHHFHSTAHEVLGCYRGHARIMFGGPMGFEVDFNCGDAVLIPAGVAHRLIKAEKGFSVVGAYPSGTSPDMCEGDPKEFDVLLHQIKKLQAPSSPMIQIS